MRLGFEEGGPGARKEFMRSDSDNWRMLREEQEEEDTGETGGSWRLTVSRRDGNTVDIYTWHIKGIVHPPQKKIIFYLNLLRH